MISIFSTFRTYERCTFKPGESFNVIIGPNGSGKSSILAAMLLGLGGEPTLLGRSDQLKDYIRDGYQKASITVVLYDIKAKSGKEQEISFSRDLICKNDADTTSIYKVNKKVVDKKNFLKTVASFNIETNNKCLFLPQDKVQVSLNDIY